MRIVKLPSRFGLYDEAEAERAELCGVEYEFEGTGEAVLLLDLDEVEAVIPAGDPIGSECIFITRSGEQYPSTIDLDTAFSVITQ